MFLFGLDCFVVVVLGRVGRGFVSFAFCIALLRGQERIPVQGSCSRGQSLHMPSLSYILPTQTCC